MQQSHQTSSGAGTHMQSSMTKGPDRFGYTCIIAQSSSLASLPSASVSASSSSSLDFFLGRVKECVACFLMNLVSACKRAGPDGSAGSQLHSAQRPPAGLLHHVQQLPSCRCPLTAPRTCLQAAVATVEGHGLLVLAGRVEHQGGEALQGEHGMPHPPCSSCNTSPCPCAVHGQRWGLCIQPLPRNRHAPTLSRLRSCVESSTACDACHTHLDIHIGVLILSAVHLGNGHCRRNKEGSMRHERHIQASSKA